MAGPKSSAARTTLFQLRGSGGVIEAHLDHDSGDTVAVTTASSHEPAAGSRTADPGDGDSLTSRREMEC
jgi:hypothetical protein